jgi:lipopolysaccharide biosynthesis glycosyltransferase
MIKNNHLFNDDKIKFEINDTYNTIDKACKARLNLFNLPSILNYNKILYLDTDIVVKNNINKVIDVCKKDILYVLEEGNLRHPKDFYGKSLFGNELKTYSHTTTAFTSGILLFNNCEKIKSLFNKINEDIIKRPHYFHDQPHIVYNAFKYNLYDNNILKALAVNNDNNIHSDKVIHHFPGHPGIYQHKIVPMTNFLNTLNKYTFKNGMKIYDVKFPPKKNISFSLIGICVSYNYFDSFQFMLPVNHLHFEKMYIITQQNDIRTIELCKKFNNVTVLFFDLIKHDKPFDKYNALNYAQKIAYTEHPESWYLIIDSDIILPNNFIDILNKENLNSDCIYGAIRNNCLKIEILEKVMSKEYKKTEYNLKYVN